MSDTPPELNWESAPGQFREAHERTQAQVAEQREQLAAAQVLARENVMLRAGVDPEGPIGKLFIAGYGGELEVEKVKAAYAEVAPAPTGGAPLPGEAPDDSNEPTADELELQRRRAALRGDSTPPGGEPAGDLIEAVYDEYHSQLKRGRRRKDAGAQALTKLFDAAVDPNHPQHDQAIFNYDEWYQQNQPSG